MQVILDYFGEVTHETCGKCDVCMDRKKKDNGKAFHDYEQQVKYLLTEKPMTVDELESAIAPRDRHLLIEVIREMVEQGTIQYDEFWVLRLSARL